MHGLLAVASEVLEDPATRRVRERLEKIVGYGLRSLHGRNHNHVVMDCQYFFFGVVLGRTPLAVSRSRTARFPSAASGSKSSPPHTLVFAPPTSYDCSDENLV